MWSEKRMKRPRFAAFVLLACGISAAGGYWFGFREALQLGLMADRLPRGVTATQELGVLQAGNGQHVATALEFDVDEGLVWGYDVLNHPLRNLFGPVWGFNVYPDYEKYATRLADYRRQHPSPMTQQNFSHNKPDSSSDEAQFHAMLGEGAKLHQSKLNAMVERYASKQ